MGLAALVSIEWKAVSCVTCAVWVRLHSFHYSADRERRMKAGTKNSSNLARLAQEYFGPAGGIESIVVR